MLRGIPTQAGGMNPVDSEIKSSGSVPKRVDQRELLPQRVYRFRMLGMGLAALPLGIVMHEHQAPVGSWIWGVFTCALWPQLAYWRAQRSPNRFNAELHNLMFDSAIAGSWAALLHFTVLPAVLLTTVATADKINTGVRGLWRRSLPGMVLAMLVAGSLTGFAFQPETSMPALLACLPIMLIHTLSVSLASSRLVHKVRRQNRQLDELSRQDVLTGLNNRRSWQLQAGSLLERRHATGRAATLIMIDVDRFKDINDRHGHVLGDDVLCNIAVILRRGNGADAHIARFGRDEFAIALPVALAEATVVAERIRRAVEELSLDHAPDLRCSISLGLAEAGDTDVDLRQWMESADRALYRAKQSGRNNTVLADRPVTVSA